MLDLACIFHSITNCSLEKAPLRIHAIDGLAVLKKLWRTGILCFSLVFASSAFALDDASSVSWFQRASGRLHDIWEKGDRELYMTGYAWHNRYTYSKERLKSYNEEAWGAGFGKTYLDEDGDWHSLYAFAFLDSHRNVEPALGYSFLKMLEMSRHLGAGLGLTALITARADMYHNIPFPGVLPFVGVKYRHAWLQATYIPGAKDTGNVLFLMAKWTF